MVSSPLSQVGQQQQSMQPFAQQQMGNMHVQGPLYYMQPPQMYYPPSAYAYPGGMVVAAPSKEQVEDAVQKQVES